MMITIDEATHTYRDEAGGLIPGVTSILERLSAYSTVPRQILEDAAIRGTQVHRATELRDKGTIDYESVSEEIMGYLIGYERFMADRKPEIIEIEKLVYHPKIGYAGTLDRVYRLGGLVSLVDIKSSLEMMPGVGPQLAAYKEAYNLDMPRAEKITRRYGLQLKRDGTYELHPYTDVQDWNVFLACITLNNFDSRKAA